MSTSTLTLTFSSDSTSVSDGTNVCTVSEVSCNGFEVFDSTTADTLTIDFKCNLNSGDASNCSVTFSYVPPETAYDSCGNPYTIDAYYNFSFAVNGATYFYNSSEISQTGDIVNIPIEYVYKGAVEYFFTTQVTETTPSILWTFDNNLVNTMSINSTDDKLTFSTTGDLNSNIESVCIIGVMSGITFLNDAPSCSTTGTYYSDLIAGLLLIAYSFYFFTP